MSERMMSVVRRKLSGPSDSGLNVPGTPQDRVALVDTLTAEAWSLAGFRVPEYDRATAPIHIRPLRAVPPHGRAMNPDFLDFLKALIAADARFIVVGAHALAAHGVPRATGDIDVWIDRAPENAARVWRA